MKHRKVFVSGRPTEVSDQVTDTQRSIPADWVIVNAPRPLFGNIQFTGDFISGIFYAALDPADEYFQTWMDANKKLDARVIHYVTESELAEALEAHKLKLQERYSKEAVDGLEAQDLFDSYWTELDSNGKLEWEE